MAKKDNTAMVPIVLFAIFAAVVAYSIYKGTHSPAVE
jgi:hypothetical protein